MEADTKSHLCAISLSQSVCELCVCVTVCVAHLFPLSLFNTASLGSWVGQRRKSEKAQSFQIGSMAEQIRSVIIKLLGLPVILMNYRHWIVSLSMCVCVCVCCERSERKTIMQPSYRRGKKAKIQKYGCLLWNLTSNKQNLLCSLWTLLGKLGKTDEPLYPIRCFQSFR